MSRSRPTDHNRAEPYVESLAAVTTAGSVLHLLCVNDMTPGNGGPRHISRSELRASFRVGWDVVSIEADRLETSFDPSGLPAWRAQIRRA